MTLSVPTRATGSGGWCAKPRVRPVPLDAPAGSLWLTRALARRGFEADAVDRLPHEQHAGGGLDEGLAQFADRTFDHVVFLRLGSAHAHATDAVPAGRVRMMTRP